MFDRFRSECIERLPHVDCFHVLNESLLQDLTRGEERTGVYRRVVQQLLLAADTGPSLVVWTCCSTSPAVDLVRAMCAAPVLKVDDPLAAEAVRVGRRIAVMCTNTSSPGPMAALVRAHAAAQGQEVMVETVVRPEAYTALFAGDMARHDAIVAEAAREALPRYDVLLLPHVSLEHLQEELEALGKPVLSSPLLLMAELDRRLASMGLTG